MRHFPGCLTVAVLAMVVTSSAYGLPKGGTSVAGMGLGLQVNPARFDFALGMEYRYDPHLAPAFDLHLVPFNNGMVFGFIPQVRYYIDASSTPKWNPFFGAGLGLDIATNGSGALDIMVPSFGVDYQLTKELNFGSDFGLHIVTDFSTTNPNFHLLLARIKYKF